MRALWPFKTSPDNRKAGYRAGVRAEYYAAMILRFKGYRIWRMRYKTRVGEIDIVAQRGGRIVFVEVKYRKTFDKGAESVLPSSQLRIRRAAEQYMLEKYNESPSMEMDMRFDVVVVNRSFFIRHIKNAF